MNHKLDVSNSTQETSDKKASILPRSAWENQQDHLRILLKTKLILDLEEISNIF